MNFTVVDAGGLMIAVVACAALVILPGIAITRMFGFTRTPALGDLLTGLLIGLATLPAIDSLITRFLGLDVALALNMMLALGGAIVLHRDDDLRPSRLALGLAVAWLTLVTVEWVDLDIAGKLYQPLTIFDVVKHAATTQAIYDSGAPPRDAFFLRPERASYYYFFYTPAALAMRLCFGLIDAKAAVGGLVFWTGIGAFALTRLALARTRIALSIQRPTILVVAVLGAGGFDILIVLIYAWTRHYWITDPLQWNEQVAAWFEDVLWVPHHVTALIAGTIGLIALCDEMEDPKGSFDMRSLLATMLAGLSFAASLGLSVWVTLGFAATMAAWSAILLVERRWRALGLLALAGGVALAAAFPQILDLKAGRAGGGPVPVALVVRGFTPVEVLFGTGPWRAPAQILSLPINYAFEFGPLALGTYLFWRQRRRGDGAVGGEFARVLVVGTVTCLLLGAFLRSTLFHNDLGWRVLLLPLLAGTVWTISAADRLIAAPAVTNRVWRPVLATAFCLGWATMLFAAASMRAYPFMTINPGARFMAADRETERALRVAFDWVSLNLPASAVVQQNPTFRRAFAFGVYGRNPTGVADSFGSLYGADPRAVAERIAAIGPVFDKDLSTSDVIARATANNIDDLVVTASDPVWSQPDSFVWRVKPVFASARVRIIPVVTLEATR